MCDMATAEYMWHGMWPSIKKEKERQPAKQPQPRPFNRKAQSPESNDTSKRALSSSMQPALAKPGRSLSSSPLVKQACIPLASNSRRFDTVHDGTEKLIALLELSYLVPYAL